MEEERQVPSRLARIGLRIMLWALGLSLIAFIPFLPIGLVEAKGIILTVGAIAGVLLWLLDAISRGRFLFPQGISWLIFMGAIVLAAIASFFVPNPSNSFIGNGFEMGTVTTLSISFVYFFLISLWGRNVNFTKLIVQTFFIAGCAIILFSALQMVFNIVGRMPRFFLSLGSGNLVGSHNDMAIFLGLFVSLIAIGLENRFFRRFMKGISIAMLAVSLFFLLLINYTFVWYLVGVAGISLFIWRLMPKLLPKETENETRIHKSGFSIPAFVLIVLSFIAIVGARDIGRFVAGKPFYFTNNEPRPSLVSSLSIIKTSYARNLFTGAGMNRYPQAWEYGKTRIWGGNIMASPYWNASFTGSTGIFFTLLTTLGILGALLFLWFVGIILFKKIFGLFAKEGTNKLRPKELMIYGFLSFYAFIIFLFDSPSPVYLVLILAFFGMLSSYLAGVDGLKEKSFSFVHDSRYSFFSILSVLVGIMLLSLSTYGIARAHYAQYLVNSASLLPASRENIAKGKERIARAVGISGLDSHARALTSMNILSIAYLLNDKSGTEESLRSALKDEVNAAVESAKLAISLDPKNHQNYLNFLRVQETLIELGGADIYPNAIEVANQALVLSPNNLGILYRQAKMASFTKHYADAGEYINKILAINPSLIDAYLLRSQIALSQGDVSKALSEINEAERVLPGDATLLYQKGLLFLNQGSYSDAAEIFEGIIRLSPGSIEVYSNLALAYEKLGRRDAVIGTLENAKKYMNDTAAIDALIEKVRAGGSLVEKDLTSGGDVSGAKVDAGDVKSSEKTVR